jgi:hypothetical protein
MRKLLPLLVVAACLAPLAATASASPPPLRVKIYAARAGGYQMTFYMQHSAGWNWHGTGTGANRLGCSVSGSYWDNAVPAGIWQFGPVALKPVGNPYEVSIALGHWDQQVRSINATCTLRHLTAKHRWLYKTITAHWNGT